MLIQLAVKCRELKTIKGETAAQFAKRDPQAAGLLAAFIVANKAALVKSIARVL